MPVPFLGALKPKSNEVSNFGVFGVFGGLVVNLTGLGMGQHLVGDGKLYQTPKGS